MHSPNWARSAAFLTYDEHGGFYDDLAPPAGCLPDEIEPQLGKGATPGRFDHLGMRVPFIVVSPYAKPHYVSHRVFSHSSLLRLIEARFDLPAISARVANAEPPLDLFDFKHPHFATPPSLPEAKVDQAELTRCRKVYPPESDESE
jgi:phospholipase C